MFDVIAMGSATADIFIQTGKSLFRDVHEGCVRVPFGSKILIKEIQFDSGGGATNTAVSFARFGLKSAFIGKIGTGAQGHLILHQLRKEGVNCSLVTRADNCVTDLSVILDAKGHDRTILNYKGCSGKLRYDDIKLSRVKTKWLYCSSMVGVAFKTLEKLVKHSQKKGIKVMFNPSSYMVKLGPKHLKRVLKYTDVLVFNREECETLVGKVQIKKLMKRCHEFGPKTVIITHGKKGVYASDGEHIYKVRPHRIKVVETTGAGDAFGAGFLTGMIKKNDIKYALALGIANSESVIQKAGAKTGLLRWRESIKQMREKPTMITKVK